VERAKAEGKLRDDVESTDFAVIHLMLGAIVDFTEPVVPETWRRFLDIVLDGLRPRSGAPALKGRPLDDDELDSAMGSWPWRYRT
jgi:hypothetical protein